ncbi:c-type cytochrome [Roseovarius sp. SYSU LYC5161]|uniref:c-type cytochrome n=1 Tax=Roseovarius halophilus (ex Wu et al. 2025) TaxID=3376060 RepID=UPI00399B4C12
MYKALALGVIVLAACTQAPSPQAGKRHYVSNCAVCHGLTGRGDGPLASVLATRPADLTRLSAQNGGSFPATRAMARIHGYPGRFEVMPDFGPMLTGPTVTWRDESGMALTTPKALLDLAAYLATIQTG